MEKEEKIRQEKIKKKKIIEKKKTRQNRPNHQVTNWKWNKRR